MLCVSVPCPALDTTRSHAFKYSNLFETQLYMETFPLWMGLIEALGYDDPLQQIRDVRSFISRTTDGQEDERRVFVQT